jgi:glycosyltransferase involved in cell wall biosynthesis
MHPCVSVIVPHLNQHAALSRLLTCLEEQDQAGVSFEVIVCDNGSIRPLPEGVFDNPRVTVVEETTPGPGPARNRGVSVARGSVLAFIDADCFPDRGWMRTIYGHFAKPDAASVIGGDVRIAPRGAQMDCLEAYESVFGYRFELYIRRDGYAGTGNLAMRRDVFEAVGPFAGISIAEDRDWGQRATRAGFRPAYVPEMIVFTRARGSFSELARKWDRHIAHEFAGPRDLVRNLKWILRSIALAASPIFEIPRMLLSSRVSGVQTRFGALLVLIRVRLFRARRMLQLLAGGDAEALARSWQKN